MIQQQDTGYSRLTLTVSLPLPALLMRMPTGTLPTTAAIESQVAESILLKSAGTTLVLTLKEASNSAATVLSFSSVRDTRMMFVPASHAQATTD